MFNDSITITYNGPVFWESKKTNVDLIRTGIAWKSDRERKFRNPDFFDNSKHPLWNKFTKPKSKKLNKKAE